MTTIRKLILVLMLYVACTYVHPAAVKVSYSLNAGFHLLQSFTGVPVWPFHTALP